MKLKSLFLMAVAFALFANSANAEWGTFEQKKREWAAKLNLPPIVGTWYYADMENGLETNSGLLPELAVCSLQTAVDKCVTGNGDGVALLVHTSAGSTWSFAVSKPCTLDAYGMTVYGIAAPNRYFGRARIISSGSNVKASGLANVLVVRAQNVHLYNLHINNQDSTGWGGVSWEASRGYAENCHFLGGSNAFSDTSTSVYCLKVSSASELRFKDCVLGTRSTERKPNSAGQGNLYLTGAQGQNVFEDCIFYSYSTDNDHNAIFVGAATTVAGWINFDRCKFQCWKESETPSNTDAVVGGTAQNNAGLLMNDCTYVGFLEWDNIDANLTFVRCSAPTDSIGFCVPQ